MHVSLKSNFSSLLDVVNFRKDDWEAAGRLIRQRIRQRTAKGVDGQNRGFAPYSSSYAEQRKKAGLPTSPVNLTLSGEMLNGIIIEATRLGVTVTFRD